MRLHRFYTPEEIGDKDSVVIRDSALIHQLLSVFRFTVGGQIILFDNTGFEYYILISSLENGEIMGSVISKKESKNTPARELHLFYSITKKDTFEWVLEKGTELGVTRFIPILSDRSEKKNINIERAEKILIEASEQSGRATLPVLSQIMNLEDAINAEFPCFAFDPKGDTFTIEHAQNYSPLGIFVGPEGGWTDREIFLFKKNNMRVYSLGHQTLRAETAAVAISSLILLQ